jgi:hypothetical protein
LDLSEEDARLASGLAFIKSSFVDAGIATELARAFAARWLAVAEPVLAEYRQLLLEHPTEEALFQRFFTAHPSILEPDAMQIWPHPALQGIAEPDFIVRRRDDRYVIIELKTPDERIATAGGHLSAPVTRSIDQVRRYQDLMVGQIDRIQRHFPGFRQPDGLVVIGMEACMADRGRQALLRENAARTDVRVVGFDWLAERAEAIVRNIIDAGVEVTRIRIE